MLAMMVYVWLSIKKVMTSWYTLSFKVSHVGAFPYCFSFAGRKLAPSWCKKDNRGNCHTPAISPALLLFQELA
jgi:hypothetical protein